MFEGPSPPGSHRPRLAVAPDPSYWFPSSPMPVMLHASMGTVTVRVIPRSRATSVTRDEAGAPVIRVRAAPEGGRATDEARRALADALGVAPSRITLRTGARARTKVFEVEEVTDEEIAMRLRATRHG